MSSHARPEQSVKIMAASLADFGDLVLPPPIGAKVREFVAAPHFWKGGVFDIAKHKFAIGLIIATIARPDISVRVDNQAAKKLPAWPEGARIQWSFLQVWRQLYRTQPGRAV